MPDRSTPAAAPAPPDSGERPRSHAWPRLLRVHHWVKNLLLGVPFLTAQAWHRPGAAIALGAGMLALSLIASATYVLNDLADLEHDRAHRAKRHRPLASGQVGVPAALVVSALFAAAGFGLAYVVGVPFLTTMLVYGVLTTLYTRWLKRETLVDVVALAALWTLRLVAGAAAIGVELSAWLLSFGAFLFLSLSLAKRVAELGAFGGDPQQLLPGRGYARRDLPALLAFGVATGVVSVLVLALFVDSTPAQLKYPHHERLWLACPALWYWIARLWLETARGHMHHDPLVFSLRDRASWFAFAAIALVWGAALSPLGP